MKFAEWAKMKRKAALLSKAASILNTEEKHLPKVVERFLREIKEMDIEIRKLSEK